MYYTNSVIKSAVENWFNTNITGDNASKVADGNYFCEQAKLVYNSNFSAGSAIVTKKENYTPSFNCATDGNGKGVVSGKVGLITIDEVLYAGGVIASDADFYLKNDTTFWTMSPAGFYNSISFAYNWGINDYGDVNYYTTSNSYSTCPVLNLNANVKVTGNGTFENPYVVE